MLRPRREPALPSTHQAHLIDAPAAPAPAGAPRLRARRLDALRAAREWLPEGRSLPYADWRPRHRWLVTLLWLHAVALPIFAISRGYSVTHSLLEGGVVGLFAGAAAAAPIAPRWRAVLAAVGLVTSSAVLVHFSGGAIEAHFHFFVVLILLTLYEDWIPFLVAFGYVVVHHGVAGTFAPESVYNHADAIAHPWKWALIHGGFVSAAGAGAIAAWRLNEDARARTGEAIARAVESQQSSDVKDRFIATTSHELRTPLTSIAGFATTLAHRWGELDDSDKRASVDIINAQAARLSELIEELLLFSAIERGQVRLKREPVRVAAVVERIVAGLGPGPAIAVDVPRDLVAVVDERYLAQIVENYLSNARKYGAPPITVAATDTPLWVEISVTDCGAGVPDAFLPQLFEPFARAVDDPRIHGSGLGLSIVRGLVEAQGGDAWYERGRQAGACFKVRFPQQPRRADTS
jgi:signal transduction histidine kinase